MNIIILLLSPSSTIAAAFSERQTTVAEVITAAPAMELRSNHAGPADKQMACARLPTVRRRRDLSDTGRRCKILICIRPEHHPCNLFEIGGIWKWSKGAFFWITIHHYVPLRLYVNLSRFNVDVEIICQAIPTYVLFKHLLIHNIWKYNITSLMRYRRRAFKTLRDRVQK